MPLGIGLFHMISTYADTIEAVVDSSPRGIALPLYAYRCTQCGNRFEKIQSFSSEPETECPKCQGLLERPLTAPGLSFKGAGWYVNDYAGKSSAGTSSEASAPAAACPSAGACPAAGSCGAASETT
jgi:putative FmdB family regulatory protein